MEEVKFNVEITVPFRSYDDKKKNSKAKTFLRKWIEDMIRMELSYIPMYVEKDETGAWLEDSSKKTKIKVTRL